MLTGRRIRRQIDEDHRALADLRFDADSPVVLIDDTFRNGKAQSESFVLSCSVEGIKYLCQVFLWNAHAGIGDLKVDQLCAVVSFSPRAYTYSSFLRDRLHRIQDQVDHDLLDLAVIAFKKKRLCRKLLFYPDLFLFELLLTQAQRFFHQCKQVDAYFCGSGWPGKGQQVIDKFACPQRIPLDRIKAILRIPILELPLEQLFRVGKNYPQRIVDLMSNSCGHLTHDSQALRLNQLFLQPLPLCDVPRKATDQQGLGSSDDSGAHLHIDHFPALAAKRELSCTSRSREDRLDKVFYFSFSFRRDKVTDAHRADLFSRVSEPLKHDLVRMHDSAVRSDKMYHLGREFDQILMFLL